MDDKRFHVGDKVIVRDWEDMAAEYEVDDDGDIVFPGDLPYFTTEMRQFCGQAFTVTKINEYDCLDDERYTMVLDIPEDDGGDWWSFCPEMLILADDLLPEQEIEVDAESFFGVAFS